MSPFTERARWVRSTTCSRAAAALFIGIMVYTLRAGKKVTNPNYWEDELGTLEWTLPNPPPEHTFETLPKQSDWDKGHAH